jgi:hypothetical protein
MTTNESRNKHKTKKGKKGHNKGWFDHLKTSRWLRATHKASFWSWSNHHEHILGEVDPPQCEGWSDYSQNMLLGVFRQLTTYFGGGPKACFRSGLTTPNMFWNGPSSLKNCYHLWLYFFRLFIFVFLLSL